MEIELLLNNIFTLLLTLVSSATELMMLLLFLRYSQPYDPVWGRELKQKDKVMLVFNS